MLPIDNVTCHLHLLQDVLNINVSPYVPADHRASHESRTTVLPHSLRRTTLRPLMLHGYNSHDTDHCLVVNEKLGDDAARKFSLAPISSQRPSNHDITSDIPSLSAT